jgi:hypothetical protein
VSRDLDLFHDTAEALELSWQEDRRRLVMAGFDVTVVREHPSFVEATVARGGETVLMRWAQDSAFRFFPLLGHDQLGLVLHPVDLATNKVLALVGRLEVRDWVDVIESNQRLQPLGYLAWAAAGKDPGFSPAAILEQGARSARYQPSGRWGSATGSSKRSGSPWFNRGKRGGRGCARISVTSTSSTKASRRCGPRLRTHSRSSRSSWGSPAIVLPTRRTTHTRRGDPRRRFFSSCSRLGTLSTGSPR